MQKVFKVMKKPWLLASLVFLMIAWIVWNIPIEKRKYGLSQHNLLTDYTGLLPERVERVIKAEAVTDLQKLVKDAIVNGRQISVAGLQHSQGGHTYYKDGVVLDMRTFNKVLAFDPMTKTIRVEAGATWEDVQEVINSHGLALKVTQSQSIFTIGGSLSVNAHGRDIRFGSMAGTIKEMTLLTPTGEIKTVNRDDQEDWMKYVFGGFGLFGVILDVTLELTDNDVYLIQTEQLSLQDYEAYFMSLLANKETAMHYARVSVAPKTFLEEMYVINYDYTGKKDDVTPLKEEDGARLSKLALDLGRQGGKLEDLFWEIQKKYIDSIDGRTMTRNNVMRSESTFMEFTKPSRVEVLQEFFVPIDSYEEYMNDLKQLLSANDKDEDFKVHNITVRYAAKDDGTHLNYAKEDMFGLVILIQHGLKENEVADAETIIQKWTDLTLQHGGTYYLPYYRYQSRDQFMRAYPQWEQFKKEKESRDPNEVFQNLFYDHYIK
ncbi:FAD-binding oxidoreductase [Halalkalibacter urbisdiaboli]|uniref:FAD-binding oxidoreductase n=1 Tax=Halalkalibacter urbisdiaboli TaxID=1960589 RepID=UPI000B42F90F|nr:FAD-binding oxidoreductase [Halalkalibacter urbisdiaboli]